MGLDNDPATAGADDTSLFNEVVSSPPTEAPEPPPQPQPPPSEQPPPQQQPEAAVPAGRLREEADARRAAERERDEFRRQIDALILRQQPPKEQPKRSDMFEQPSQFVREEVQPLLDPVQKQVAEIREHFSLQNALARHGDEKVMTARKELESAMGARDSEAWTAYNRAMASIDPYGVIMSWHNGKEVLSTVGTDLGAYRQKILDEAAKDPEFQKKVFEQARGQAANSGNSVNRPATPKLPSIGKVGAAAPSNDADDNMSDEELFQAATRRR